MALLLDLSGYLSVLLRGLALTAQPVAAGGAAFLLLLAWPLASRLDPVSGPAVIKWAGRLTAWAGLTVAVVATACIALQLAALVGSAGMPLERALGAGFTIAWGVQAFAGLASWPSPDFRSAGHGPWRALSSPGLRSSAAASRPAMRPGAWRTDCS